MGAGLGFPFGGKQGIPATQGLSANVAACHSLWGEVTARVAAGGGSGCSVRDLVPGSLLGSALLCSVGLAVCPLLLPPCTFWHPHGPTRRSSFVRPQFAPGRRGKAVRSQLLRPGQIPGVFLKEAGWGTATGSVCAATAIVRGEK